MREAPFKLNLHEVANVYSNGSVIESRLTGWMESGFKEYGESLQKAAGSVQHTGEGEWTVKAAKKLGVPVPVIKAAFDFRVQSAKKPSYTGKILSMLRNQFGGHSIG
jgi:6-phosphogluconate dehydrogenase